MSKYRFITTFEVDFDEAHDEKVSQFEERTRQAMIDSVDENWETCSNIRCTIEDDYCLHRNNMINNPHFISKDAQHLAEEKNEYYASAKLILNHLEVHSNKENPFANDITTALMTAVNCLLEKGGSEGVKF